MIPAVESHIEDLNDEEVRRLNLRWESRRGGATDSLLRCNRDSHCAVCVEPDGFPLSIYVTPICRCDQDQGWGTHGPDATTTSGH
jgi:hypothetical protein